MYTSLDELIPLAVVVGDDPYVAVAGVDPMSFLNRVDDDFVTPDVPADSGSITMEFGDLPEGYAVISNEGEPANATAYVATYLDSPGATQSGIFVGTEPFMVGRDALPVDVNGTSAWLSTLARSLRFVPFAEWAEAHGVDLDAVSPGDRVPF